ncbi:MAG: heavy-metal-associated domain-containing protein [Ignavibacteriales bacterium]
MNKIIKVQGMSCEHCVKRITNVINEIEGAECINISLENETVEVEYLNEEVLKQIEDAIIDLGYEIV